MNRRDVSTESHGHNPEVSIRKRLVGAWRLSSFEFRLKEMCCTLMVNFRLAASPTTRRDAYDPFGRLATSHA